MYILARLKPAALVLALALLLAGCITVGMEFNKNAVDLIKPGQTTLEEVRKMFGNPVRTGMDEGKLSWTYLRYRATLGGDFDGQDLVVKFDAQNKVTSFSYHSTDTAREIKR